MSIDNFPYASLVLGFSVSLVFSLLIVLTTRWHGRYSLDATHGVQKFHITPTPRIGGVAIFAGLWSVFAVQGQAQQELLLPLLAAAVPAFLFGVAEDLTRKVSVRARLLATMASGVICWALTGVALTNIGLAPFDLMLAWTPFAVVFTAFAVSGVANAVNIIDGFHGLASGTVLIGLTALGLIALDCGDLELAGLCLTIGVATIGFFVVNFPFGKLFLGDGGAYLLGFLLAWLSVMLVYRNPTVSAWAPLLACGYPVFETVFTILRRMWCRRHPGLPDSRHLHSLIKTMIAARYFRVLPPRLRNAAVSPFAWSVALLPAMLAVRFAEVPDELMQSAMFSFALYIVVYTLVASSGRRRVRAAVSVPVTPAFAPLGEESEIEAASRRAAG